MKICTVEGCFSKSRTRGLCNKHALRMRQTGTTDAGVKARGSLAERFWRYVPEGRQDDDCWEWTGSRRRRGYGRIQAAGKGSRALVASRVSYELHHGPIPPDAVVMHTCDNPPCVNPKHLILGSFRDNTADMERKGRRVVVAPLGESNGKAVLDEQKVRFIKANPQISHAEMARQLGVGPNTVRGVRTGRTWRHVHL